MSLRKEIKKFRKWLLDFYDDEEDKRLGIVLDKIDECFERLEKKKICDKLCCDGFESLNCNHDYWVRLSDVRKELK